MDNSKYVTIRLNRKNRYLKNWRRFYTASDRTKPKWRNQERLSYYPSELQGPPTNKYGGNNMQILRGYRTAGVDHDPCRQLSSEEARDIAGKWGIPLSDDYGNREDEG